VKQRLNYAASPAWFLPIETITKGVFDRGIKEWQGGTSVAGTDKFTQKARRVLSLAQKEAERMRAEHIGTEHFLLGLPAASCAILGLTLTG